MRAILVFVLAVSATVTIAWGQQDPAHKTSRAELLAEIRSVDVIVRSKAFEQLRSDPAALGDPKVKAALVNLLDRENHEPLFGEEEDYAEYTSWLADTVTKLVDWTDPRQVCVLANSLDLPDELADHAKVTIPCLLQKVQNAPSSSRGMAVGMLVQALAKGRSNLDANTIQTVHQVILRALHDPADDVKIPTVKALERFGEDDMIPALKIVAETDPDPSEGYAIRKWAAEAIIAIQKRAGQQ
jgi:hypothetical protein